MIHTMPCLLVWRHHVSLQGRPQRRPLLVHLALEHVASLNCKNDATTKMCPDNVQLSVCVLDGVSGGVWNQIGWVHWMWQAMLLAGCADGWPQAKNQTICKKLWPWQAHTTFTFQSHLLCRFGCVFWQVISQLTLGLGFWSCFFAPPFLAAAFAFLSSLACFAATSSLKTFWGSCTCLRFSFCARTRCWVSKTFPSNGV